MVHDYLIANNNLTAHIHYSNNFLLIWESQDQRLHLPILKQITFAPMGG